MGNCHKKPVENQVLLSYFRPSRTDSRILLDSLLLLLSTILPEWDRSDRPSRATEITINKDLGRNWGKLGDLGKWEN
jgi:hypothetical protein